jgi:hypothetical protein
MVLRSKLMKTGNCMFEKTIVILKYLPYLLCVLLYNYLLQQFSIIKSFFLYLRLLCTNPIIYFPLTFPNFLLILPKSSISAKKTIHKIHDPRIIPIINPMVIIMIIISTIERNQCRLNPWPIITCM